MGAHMKNLLVLLLLVPGASFAEDDELEDPGTVRAIQERAYQLRHELTVGLGVLPVDAFYKGLTFQLGYSYHFSDTFAWQVGRAMYSYNLATGLRRQLERDFGVLPTEFEQVEWMFGSDVVFSPLYGKTALLNRAIVHFELFGIGGGSGVKTQEGIRPAARLGGGVRVFTERGPSFRFDATNDFVLARRPFNVLTLAASVALDFGGGQ